MSVELRFVLSTADRPAARPNPLLSRVSRAELAVQTPTPRATSIAASRNDRGCGGRPLAARAAAVGRPSPCYAGMAWWEHEHHDSQCAIMPCRRAILPRQIPSVLQCPQRWWWKRDGAAAPAAAAAPAEGSNATDGQVGSAQAASGGGRAVGGRVDDGCRAAPRRGRGQTRSQTDGLSSSSDVTCLLEGSGEVRRGREMEGFEDMASIALPVVRSQGHVNGKSVNGRWALSPGWMIGVFGCITWCVSLLPQFWHDAGCVRTATNTLCPAAPSITTLVLICPFR